MSREIRGNDAEGARRASVQRQRQLRERRQRPGEDAPPPPEEGNALQERQQQQQQIGEPQDDTESVISASALDNNEDEEPSEREETIHERAHRERQNKHHRHQYHKHYQHHPHVKEFIKADRSSRTPAVSTSDARAPPQRTVATVVDEQQLHQRLVRSKSENSPHHRGGSPVRTALDHSTVEGRQSAVDDTTTSRQASKSSSSSSSSGSQKLRSNDSQDRSPPPAAIIIPASLAKSLSTRPPPLLASQSSKTSGGAESASGSSANFSNYSGPLTREQLEYGSLLRNGEVQVLYRNYDTETSQDRALKDKQAMLVAPGLKQSPIAIMSMNPTYRLANKPLVLDYPNTIENVRLNNTGFSWEVKIPYQITINTALHGAHLSVGQYYRLDHFHCHWGASESRGSEHTIDGRSYSAELHFVHYNMEKYHSIAKAARHPDGLAVLAVFLEADKDQRKHAELDKVVSQLKLVALKGEHTLIKQSLRIGNLLPANKSYWSYQGSLTTPPYLESVTWFILKQPLKCSACQIENFRSISTALTRGASASEFIRSNHRQTQPLNGRTIVTYDEPHKGSH